jgi:hypothetical protein
MKIHLFILGFAFFFCAGRTQAEIFWRSDFEDGTIGTPTIWSTCQRGKHDDSLRVVDSGPIANGKHALDIHVYPDDTPSAGDKEGHKSRDELSQGGNNELAKDVAKTHSGPGQTAFYRIAYYFPSDLNPNEHGYNIIGQFHAVGGKARPCIDMSIECREKPAKLEISAKGGKEANPELKKFELGGIPSNAWVEVIIGIHWSTTDGWIEIWRREGLKGDWNNIVARTNTPTLYEDKEIPGAYMKLGYYRGPDGQIGKAKGPWKEVSHLIIDNVMAGDTLDDVRNENPK